MFRAFVGHRFEWRFWGVLESMAMQMANLWSTFTKYWDYEFMSKKGDLTYAALKDLDRMVAEDTGGLPGIEATM